MTQLTAPILVPAIRLDQDAPAEEARALRRAREPWVAGFLLFGGEAAPVARLTTALRQEAGRPLFIASDMERGAGQQVRGLTSLPDAGLLGFAGSPADAQAFGEITAREARSVGIDVIFAPVVDVRSELDNPIVGNRALGWDAARVGLLATAFCAGVQAGGAQPVAKHFPGHGATREDSHAALPRVEVGAASLWQRDLRPFRELARSGVCPAVMTAHVVYPALDARGGIATFSARILERTPLIVFTDALLMAGASAGIGEVEAARRALAAGCHGLLYPEDPERVAAELLEASGDLADRAAQAAGRLAALESAFPFPPCRPQVAPASLLERPRALARRAVERAMGGRCLRPPEALWILDDDAPAGRGQILGERARQAGVPCCRLDASRVQQDASPVPSGPLAAIVVFASIRAWKGAAGVSPKGLEAVGHLLARLEGPMESIQVIWCAPAVPLEATDRVRHFHLPGTGPQVESALAEALFETP